MTTSSYLAKPDVKVEIVVKEVEPVVQWLRDQKMSVVRVYTFYLAPRRYTFCAYFEHETEAALFKLFWMEGHD